MLSKVDLVRLIYQQGDKKRPMKDLDVIVDKVFDMISDALIQGKEIQISGFGAFSLSEQMKKPVVKVKKVVNNQK